MFLFYVETWWNHSHQFKETPIKFVSEATLLTTLRSELNCSPVNSLIQAFDCLRQTTYSQRNRRNKTLVFLFLFLPFCWNSSFRLSFSFSFPLLHKYNIIYEEKTHATFVLYTLQRRFFALVVCRRLYSSLWFEI